MSGWHTVLSGRRGAMSTRLSVSALVWAGVVLGGSLAMDANAQSSGTISAWGDNANGQLNVPEPNMSFVAIAAGDRASMGLRADGSIMAWGSNTFEQCDLPVQNTGFVAIAMGAIPCVALKSDGSLVAWGGADPVPAPNTGFVAVSAGWDHCLGLKADGSIVAWGWNYGGQCDVPAPNSGFVAISAGVEHSAGLKADGSIVAWGDNTYGQCNVPVPNSDFVAVAVGGGYGQTLGLKANGSIVAWGRNWDGQCTVPAPNSGFVAIATGEAHSLGLKADGSVVAWGGNYRGQLRVPTQNSGFVAIAAGTYFSLSLRVVGPNRAPLVDAGVNQTIGVADGTTLDGTALDDGLPTLGKTLDVAWSQVSGPAAVVFADPGWVDTPATFSAAGEYVLQLSASDGEFATSDTVTVSVVPENQPPQVNAGPNQVLDWPIGAPLATVTLAGIASDDGVPDPPGVLTYTWSKESGTGIVTFADPHDPSTSATFTAGIAYVLRLLVSDGVHSSSDTVGVLFNPSPNTAPHIDAGPDRAVTWPASVALAPTVTDDGWPLPSALTYTWTKVSGPGTVSFTNFHHANTAATFSTAGVYVLQLAAYDGELTATDSLTVTVNLPFPRGDLNCDGLVNNGDIDAFVVALTSATNYASRYPGCYRALADMNEDGLINNGDVDAFVRLLTGG